MRIVKLILGIFIGLIAITVVAEFIEFTTVKLVSAKPFSELTGNQEHYFSVRNTIWILIFKIFYSLLAGIVGGYFTTWISSEKSKIAIYVLIGIQLLSLIWGGFISEMSSTGPLWMWIYLIVLVPVGVWIGYKIRIKK